MNNNITVGSNTYLLTAPSGVGGSVRIDATTGLNTPVTLSIRQQPFKEPKSGLPGQLSSIRVSIPVSVKSGSELQELSFTFSARVPRDAELDWTNDVLPILSRTLAVLASESIMSDVVQSRLA